MSVVIQVDRLSKQYRLGGLDAKRLRDDVNRWFAKIRGKGDPLAKIGQEMPARNGNGGGHEDDQLLWALKDVSFELNQGEVLGIIGRNGAGKSTLLKILSQVTEPTSGEARVKGRIASLLEVGTGFQPDLSGRDNIFLNGAILGMTKAEIRRKFDEIVAFSEVGKFIDTPVKRYSSGMYVRLAFAVAAHLEPEILIIDEVLAVGDATFQKKCLGKMGEITRQGHTVLFVSHNMAAIQNLCPSALVLASGKLSFYGETAKAVRVYSEAENENGAAVPSSRQLEGNRPAWAVARIVSARLLDSAGVERRCFPLGTDVTVEMSVQCPSHGPIRQPVMGVVINHTLFGAVSGVNMRMTGDDHYRGEFTDFRMQCHLKRLPFLQGAYSIDLWLGDSVRDVDVVVGCLNMTLEATDIYGSGRPPLSNIGVTYLEADWNVENVSRPSSSSPALC